MPPATVLQIVRMGLNVADLEGARGFYVDALGFTRVADRAGAAVLCLGLQEIELRLGDPVGRPYPAPRAANDPWFQHFAIAVSDMEAAYRRLSGHAQQPISVGGPQRLPPSTGSVTAYKFRDPDGHPLELSYSPGSAWLEAACGDSLFLGIDHSALTVRDLDASIAFYGDILGFLVGARSLNEGPEQDRLDGLHDVKVDIALLHTSELGPHIELLHYRAPRPQTPPIAQDPQDIAATVLILLTRSLGDLKARLDAAAVAWSEGRSHARAFIRLRDPDGHELEVFGAES